MTTPDPLDSPIAVIAGSTRLSVADAALVLSTLADAGYGIIKLPEGESRGWHVTDWDGGRVSLAYGVDTVRCYLPNPSLEVGEAEQLGIALIAASRHLAGEVTLT